ncbi:MAG: FHIPEP family type III secretion protein, partial [Paracoccaceae bacterium]
IFLAMGGAMSGGLLLSRRLQERREKQSFGTWYGMQEINDGICADIERRTGLPSPVMIELPPALRNFDPRRFFKMLGEVNASTERDFGVPMGVWRFGFNDSNIGEYRILIKGDVLGTGKVRTDCVFVKANASYLDTLGIPYVLHFGLEEGVMVSNEHTERLRQEKVSYWDAVDQLMMDVKRTVANNLTLFIGFQATANLLDEVAKSNPVLIGDLRDALSINQISGVLRVLVQERIPMTSRIRILETVLVVGPKKPDPFHVLQSVRIAISDFISHRFAPDGFLPCVILAPSLESFIREGFRSANDENFLILDHEIASAIIRQTKTISKDIYKRGRDPVILTQQDIRRAVHNVLFEHGIYVPVLAYQEITPQIVIYPIGFIAAQEISAAA